MFHLRVIPQFANTDGLGHINNIVLANWFEQARNPIFRLFTPDLSVNPDKWKLIMVRTEYDFLGELFYGRDVEIKSYILKIGNTSFTIGHEAWQNGLMRTRGKAVLVHYDFNLKKPIPITGDLRDTLNEHIVLPEDEDNDKKINIK
ncbi:MAG: acyl-CoA thioesterase [Methanosarcinaceae archaeon]|nr:acyl-CoA thioesterase [Methanosarcinaceae archaeon]